MVYLDYAAGEKIDDDVLNLYTNYLKDCYPNPNSNHTLGKEMMKKIDDATKKYLDLLQLDDTYEIVYTSSATESNNLALKGCAKRYKNFGNKIIISSMEHTSITASCEALSKEGFDIEVCPVKNDGKVDLDELKNMIDDNTILVSITSLDSELSIKQDLDKVLEILKDYPNIHFHTDASGIVGKENFNFNGIDLITVAPHKFGGVGDLSLLVKKKDVFLSAMISGGRSASIYRAGTPNTASILANTLSLEKALNDQKKNYDYVEKLHNKIINNLKKYKIVNINNLDKSTPYIINFSVKDVLSNTLVEYLDEREIYVSSKTSCCPVFSPSKLVYALTKNKSLANESIRVSLSKNVKEEEIDEFLNVLDEYLEKM